MSDAHEIGSTRDVVETAERYRDRLVAEIAKIDAFLQAAGESPPDECEQAQRFALETMEASPTLH